MKHPARNTILALVLVVTGVVGAYVLYTVTHTLTVNAPRPAMVADSPDTLAQRLTSVVEAPVRYDMKGALDSLEAAVPRHFGDITQRLQAGNNRRVHFAFAVSRTPFRLRVDGMTVSLSTTIEFEGRGWYLPLIGPEISAACGTAGVPRPRIVATLVSTARITKDWQLRTRTRIGRLQPFSTDGRDRCRVTIFRIDVTDRVLAATRGLLEQGLATIDSGVAGWNARARFSQLWRQLQRPIRFTDSVYMIINPFAAELGRVRAYGDTLVAPLRLLASPSIVTGQRPNEFALMKPMPALETGKTVGAGAHVLVEGALAWPVGSAILSRALKGRKLEQSGRKVTITGVEIFGIGGGRVALGIALGGAAHGKMYFTGTPRLDRIRRELYVPDLQVDVGSENLLVRGFAWLKGEEVLNLLRDRARLSEAELIGRVRELAEKGINRRLTDGIELSGRVHRAEATSVRATVADLRVRANADADLTLSINRAPSLPRPPTSRPAAPRRPAPR